MLHIPRSIAEQMIAQARAGAPKEICGMLSGLPGGPVERCDPLTNRLDSEREYEADPAEILRVIRRLDEQSWVPLVIYHSHPASPAYPSRTDRERAYWGDSSLYAIISLMNPALPDLRFYRIVDGAVAEEQVEVV
ncbi:MAG: M67 family metallopeptidase [Chloroflexi bacterium]|nr:M67 family metallopeptidase [Chloroflexota bacterium]